MNILHAVHRELDDAIINGQQVVQIRVTSDALQGSIVALPITPERARVIGQVMILETGGVVADLHHENVAELMVHSLDWMQLRSAAYRDLVLDVGAVTRIYGLPVAGKR